MSGSRIDFPLSSRILLIFLENDTCIATLKNSIHHQHTLHKSERRKELAAASKLLTRIRFGLSATASSLVGSAGITMPLSSCRTRSTLGLRSCGMPA